MFMAQVVGTVVATRKHERLVGAKLLLVRPLGWAEAREEGDPASSTGLPAPSFYPGGQVGPLVAVDAVGAGTGERVLVAVGAAARLGLADASAPVDLTIVGIIDKVDGDFPGRAQKACAEVDGDRPGEV